MTTDHRPTNDRISILKSRPCLLLIALGVAMAVVPGAAQAATPATTQPVAETVEDSDSRVYVTCHAVLAHAQTTSTDPGITEPPARTAETCSTGGDCNGAVDVECTCPNDDIDECSQGQDCTVYTDIDLYGEIDGACHVG